MNFHPDKNMPGCMLPDGGNACLGYATLRDEWNRQRWRIEALEAEAQGYAVAREVFTDRVEALEAALRGLYEFCAKHQSDLIDTRVMLIARAALAPEQD
jgi:hypothetical protein